MFAHILFPTDFSADLDAVLACLPNLKTVGLCEVVKPSVIRSSDVMIPETVNRVSHETHQIPTAGPLLRGSRDCPAPKFLVCGSNAWQGCCG